MTLMLAMLKLKYCQCADYMRLGDLHSTFMEDILEEFWALIALHVLRPPFCTLTLG